MGSGGRSRRPRRGITKPAVFALRDNHSRGAAPRSGGIATCEWTAANTQPVLIADHRRAVVAGRLGARFPRPEFAWNRTFEKEADVFAANVLMPAASFRPGTHRIPTGLKGVSALASAYGTSWVAAAYRAIELDLFSAPCAVFQWDEFGDPMGRKMSPVTFHHSLPYAGTTPRPPPGSVTARAIDRLFRWPMQRIIEGTAWFPALDLTDDFHGAELSEEVMALGSYGWLTLVQAAAP